jgi:hypothetical protein
MKPLKKWTEEEVRKASITSMLTKLLNDNESRYFQMQILEQRVELLESEIVQLTRYVKDAQNQPGTTSTDCRIVPVN